MKLSKINLFFKPKKLSQNTVSTGLFNEMLATCVNDKERRALYKNANALKEDILVLSVQKNKNENFYCADSSFSKVSGKAYKDYIESLLGTFITYSKKNTPDKIEQLKISSESLIPPDKKTMMAIRHSLEEVH